MTFTQAVRSVLGKYATFSGRATRSEYWWFYLFTILVSIVTSGIDSGLNAAFDNEIGVVGTIASLGLLLPTLAVTARRLHDTGRTGWWMLLPVIPLLATVVFVFGAVFTLVFHTYSGGNDVSTGPALAMFAVLIACGLVSLGAIVTLLVFLCQDSRPEPNKYGPSPKQPLAPTSPQGYYPPGYAQPYGYPGQQPAPPSPGSDWPQP